MRNIKIFVLFFLFFGTINASAQNDKMYKTLGKLVSLNNNPKLSPDMNLGALDKLKK